MLYQTLKHAHTLLALVTISGFALRGAWMLSGSPMLSRRWVRVAPHVIDTLFLVAGIWLVVLLQINPLTTPWLLAKFAGLLAYIVLGAIAIKRGRTRPVRAAAFVGALAVFAYVVGVALLKTPLGWFQLIEM